MEVFVSNGFLGGPILNSVSLLHQSGIDNVELSSGKCTIESLSELKLLQRQGKRFRLHNYFPNTGKPFVLNLSSADPEVRTRSRELILRALEWSSELESDYYAFHAGFRLSPKVSELGGSLNKQGLICIYDAQKYFLDELNYLARQAESFGVEMAVENNVYDSRNYSRYESDNPFLLCGDKESDIELPRNVGVLLDVAHLKVSANSLGFDFKDSVARWQDKISGYHISDNDGLVDSNSHISGESWFWSILDPSVNNVTLEVYDKDFSSLNSDISLLRSFFHDKHSEA